jgi:glucose-1-phosphate cytidylyltransferase
LGVKVVLFCGGLGMRIREDSERLPKPMIPVGDRPIVWHIMRYYAAFGHHDFVVCLGYKAEAIKDYFLNYNEALSNDFILREGGRRIELLQRDIDEWSITFVNTGLQATIGERLKAVAPHLEGEEIFLANYGDVLTDAPMNDLIAEFQYKDAVASLLAVKPQDSFHVVALSGEDRVTGLVPVADMSMRINGGYFILRQGIFDYLDEGCDLVMDGLVRAAADGRVCATPYDGFWAPMDTLKERTALEEQYRSGVSPWAVWRDRPVERGRSIVPVVMPEPTVADVG